MAKIPLGLRVEERLLARLDAWREQQPVPPARTSVVERALEAFLDHYEKGEDDGKAGKR